MAASCLAATNQFLSDEVLAGATSTGLDIRGGKKRCPSEGYTAARFGTMALVRIGERLVQAGVIDVAMLEQALKAQVLYGARLCTNLIEIAQLDLDAVAVELGRQHNLAPALGRHFSVADTMLQRKLPAEIAGRMCAVPLGLLPGERVAIAVRDPLAAVELKELRELFGREIALAVAAELRIFYYLERAYGLRRGNRFLRVRRGGTQELPILAAFQQPTATPTTGSQLTEPPSGNRGLGHRAPTHLGETELQLDDASDGYRRIDDDDDEFHIDTSEFESEFDGLEATVARLPQPVTDPAGERRRFIHTLDEADDETIATGALGRIAIRRVARGGDGELLELSFEDTLKAIKRATGRDAIGDLMVTALRDHLSPPLPTAAVLVCRENLAIGWRGFVRGGDAGVIEELAVPLDSSSQVQRAFLNGCPVVGSPLGTELDERMWSLLGISAPAWVGCAPVLVQGRTIAIIYTHSATPMPDSTGAQLVELGACAGLALERLIRGAER